MELFRLFAQHACDLMVWVVTQQYLLPVRHDRAHIIPTLGRLRHNDISDFPMGQDYTHNKILCRRTKAKQRTESQLKHSFIFQLSEHSVSRKWLFILVLGLVLGIETRASHMLSIAATSELHTHLAWPHPLFFKDDLSMLIRLVSSIFRAEVPLLQPH